MNLIGGSPVIGAVLPSGLRCACGSDQIVAVAPGHEGERFNKQFTVERGQDVQAWCMRCRFGNLKSPPATQGITMARKKTVDETVEPLPVDQEDAGEYVTENTESLREMAADTLTGDIRDFMLDRLKHEQNKRPWHERSESEQRSTVHDVEAAVRAMVIRAVELIAAAGNRSIKATLESITVKDGIKGTLTLSKHDPQRYGLMDATGRTVLVIVADPEDFTGERDPVEIKPDQSELIGEGAMVQHSADDREMPFH